MNIAYSGRVLAAIGVACTASAVLLAQARSQEAAAPALATVRVVHGIPGRDVASSLDPQLPVDVLVDGQICLIRGLTYRSVSGPFSLPAGTYNVKVSLANTVKPCSSKPVIDASVKVSAGEEAAVVAALSPEGAPTAYPFALNLSPLPAGKGRIIVAHAADAPAVDVRVNGAKAIAGLKPGQDSAAALPAGTYLVAVLPAGGSSPVIGPVPLSIASRAVDLVFAVGSVRSGSISLLVSEIPDVF